MTKGMFIGIIIAQICSLLVGVALLGFGVWVIIKLLTHFSII